MKYAENKTNEPGVTAHSNKETIMKTYKIKKVKNGYQVVWFWEGSFTGSEFKIENGFFKTLSEAENLAYELQFNQ